MYKEFNMKNNMKIKRNEIYEELYEKGVDLDSENHNSFQSATEIIASSDDEIQAFITKISTEKELFKIEDDKGNSFPNNIILQYDNKKTFSTTNPFLIENNESAPEEMNITIQNGNYEFKFKVSAKSNKSNLNKILILTVVSDITKYHQRVLNRIEPSNQIPVGIYSMNKKTEFFGEIQDITTLGIGLSFEEGFFDMDFFNELKNNKNTKLPIIIGMQDSEETENLAIMIAVRHVDKSDNKILIGADFLFIDNQEEKIIKFVELLKNKLNYKKRYDLTLQIIKNASYGV